MLGSESDAEALEELAVHDLRSPRRGDEASSREAAAVLRQGAALLQPAVQAAVDVPMDVLVVPGVFVPPETLSARKSVQALGLRLVPGEELEVKLHLRGRQRLGEVAVAVSGEQPVVAHATIAPTVHTVFVHVHRIRRTLSRLIHGIAVPELWRGLSVLQSGVSARDSFRPLARAAVALP